MRSKFEEQVAAGLAARGIEYEYEPLSFPYTREHDYTPDFRVGRVFIETKGHLDADDRAKLLAVKRALPNLDLRLVFQRASNKINKGSKTTYGEWATKHGFPWAEGRVPDEWVTR